MLILNLVQDFAHPFPAPLDVSRLIAVHSLVYTDQSLLLMNVTKVVITQAHGTQLSFNDSLKLVLDKPPSSPAPLLSTGWTRTRLFSNRLASSRQEASMARGHDQRCRHAYVQYLQETVSLLHRYFFTSSSKPKRSGQATLPEAYTRAPGSK